MNPAFEFFWPILERPTSAEKAAARQAKAADLQAIKNQPWTKEPATILAEARRLNDAEGERRKTTDVKAATYLTVVGVLTTILTSLAPGIIDVKHALPLRLASGALLIIAVSYLAMSGIWAFRTLRVSAAVRVDVPELIELWGTSTPKAGLVIQLLIAVRLNHDLVNAKLTRLKMTEEFLVRAFVTVALLLVIQVIWPAAASLYDMLQPQSKPAPTAPKTVSGTNTLRNPSRGELAAVGRAHSAAKVQRAAAGKKSAGCSASRPCQRGPQGRPAAPLKTKRSSRHGGLAARPRHAPPAAGPSSSACPVAKLPPP